MVMLTAILVRSTLLIKATPQSSAETSSTPSFGSGATAGVGWGNKSDAAAVAEQEEELKLQRSNTRLGLSADTAPYQGHTGLGSGSMAGAGYGNKMKDVDEKDSTSGKMMEKVGKLFGKDELAAKGTAKREEAGLNEEEEEEEKQDGT